jgi:hypothetical protein
LSIHQQRKTSKNLPESTRTVYWGAAPLALS